MNAQATPTPHAVSVRGVSKTYKGGFQALKSVDLDIRHGEIFALLGPNGAGKTTLISIICGIVTPSSGTIMAAGHDVLRDYRITRAKIGLVPQELSTDAFETVWASVRFSRGLFGRPRNDQHIEKVLRDLSLWEKKDSKIMTLSGGMKRRVLIAKALAHEPSILFLDEPTAGVDVELRHDMWRMVRGLRETGVTVILTTHYMVEEKRALMRKLGKKQLVICLQAPMQAVPADLSDYALELSADGTTLTYTFDAKSDDTGIAVLLRKLGERGIDFKDLHTVESSLEDIFVSLVRRDS
jgi:ABC-2 type transport system ATP-binding protein